MVEITWEQYRAVCDELFEYQDAAIKHWMSYAHTPCSCGSCQPHSCHVCTTLEKYISKETLLEEQRLRSLGMGAWKEF